MYIKSEILFVEIISRVSAFMILGNKGYVKQYRVNGGFKIALMKKHDLVCLHNIGKYYKNTIRQGTIQRGD